MPSHLSVAALRRLVPVAALAGALVLSHASANPAPGEISGTVTLQPAPEGRRPAVVVFLEDAPAPASRPKAQQSIAQRNLAFAPDFTVVVKGDSVQFPNDDRVFHNVFSLSRAARFDLGLYPDGTSKTVTFSREGVVDIFCNIHPQMIARIRVVPTPHYAIADDKGAFRLPNVPPGTWRYVAWELGGGETRGTVTVTAGGSTSLDVTVAPQKRSTEHLRKNGTPYGRYE